jgi:hypothetical protein
MKGPRLFQFAGRGRSLLNGRRLAVQRRATQGLEASFLPPRDGPGPFVHYKQHLTPFSFENGLVMDSFDSPGQGGEG